ncbi:MAG: hypothetical protein ACRDVL_04895 [Acidimicrobiia bacterium]
MSRASSSRTLASLGAPALVLAATAGGLFLVTLGLKAWLLSPPPTEERAPSLDPTIPNDAWPMFVIETEGEETVAYALGRSGCLS